MGQRGVPSFRALPDVVAIRVFLKIWHVLVPSNEMVAWVNEWREVRHVTECTAQIFPVL